MESSQYADSGLDGVTSYPMSFTGSWNKFVALVVPALSMGPIPESSSLKRLFKGKR